MCYVMGIVKQHDFLQYLIYVLFLLLIIIIFANIVFL